MQKLFNSLLLAAFLVAEIAPAMQHCHHDGGCGSSSDVAAAAAPCCAHAAHAAEKQAEDAADSEKQTPFSPFQDCDGCAVCQAAIQAGIVTPVATVHLGGELIVPIISRMAALFAEPDHASCLARGPPSGDC